MDNKKENSKAVIKYGMENLKSILNDILVIYIGEEVHAK